jgi:hypothetical protein
MFLVWCVCTEGGDLKKLKVDDLKTYLRYYGLRMIGNKATLIERIQEHLVSVIARTIDVIKSSL